MENSPLPSPPDSSSGPLELALLSGLEPTVSSLQFLAHEKPPEDGSNRDPEKDMSSSEGSFKWEAPSGGFAVDAACKGSMNSLELLSRL